MDMKLTGLPVYLNDWETFFTVGGRLLGHDLTPKQLNRIDKELYQLLTKERENEDKK